MSSSSGSSIFPILLVSTVVVCLGYVGITEMLTTGVSKANPRPQVEEVTSALKTLRTTQAAEATQPGDSTPLTAAPAKKLTVRPADHLTNSLQSQLKKQNQQRNEMIRSLNGNKASE